MINLVGRVRRVVEAAQANGATLSVEIGTTNYSRLLYCVKIVGDKMFYPNIGVRGGLSATCWIGNCKTKETAAKLAGRVRRLLEPFIHASNHPQTPDTAS